MSYIAIIFLIFCFLKCFYYGLYEMREKTNKPGGFACILLSILGLIFPSIILLKLYIL